MNFVKFTLVAMYHVTLVSLVLDDGASLILQESFVPNGDGWLNQRDLGYARARARTHTHTHTHTQTTTQSKRAKLCLHSYFRLRG
jgi:hypothetical protein